MVVIFVFDRVVVVMVIMEWLFDNRVIILEFKFIDVVVMLLDLKVSKLLYIVKLLSRWIELFDIFSLVNGNVVVIFEKLFKVVFICFKLNCVILIILRIDEDNVRLILVERF